MKVELAVSFKVSVTMEKCCKVNVHPAGNYAQTYMTTLPNYCFLKNTVFWDVKPVLS
jgi:hypothetical protein